VNWAIHLAPFFGTKEPAKGGFAANSCLISFIRLSKFGPGSKKCICIAHNEQYYNKIRTISIGQNEPIPQKLYDFIHNSDEQP